MKIVFMGSQRLLSEATIVWKDIEKSSNILLVNETYEDIVDIAKKMENDGKADAFVASGNVANLLRSNLKSPVSTIRTTAFDFFTKVRLAREISNKIIITGFQHLINDIDLISEILEVEFLKIIFVDSTDLKVKLENAKKDGFKVLVGTGVPCEIGGRLGISSFLVYSREAIKTACLEAENLAKIRQQELEKAEQVKIMLDFAYCGIIGIDRKRKITIFNDYAERITGLKCEDVKGISVDKTICSHLFKENMSKDPNINQIQMLNNTKVLLNKIPININNTVSGAILTFHEIEEIQNADKAIRMALNKKGFRSKYNFSDILGDSDSTFKTITKARYYAKTEATVLLTGETGTGKELFAHSIHNNSSRSKNPFIAINCAAIPETLLESELFGYSDGAFTGAKKGGKAGLFELAHTGTIFLDEIDSIAYNLQGKLLRAIQEKEIIRIGYDSVIPINIRVIAATNKNLEELVKKSLFREDLYYRLNVLNISIPSLKERKQDISVIFWNKLTKYNASIFAALQPYKTEIDNRLFDYDWPGNVRELENIIERIVATIQIEQINDDYIIDIENIIETIPSSIKTIHNSPNTLEYIGEVEIKAALIESEGNKEKAAELLGISRMTLWRKLKKLDLIENREN